MSEEHAENDFYVIVIMKEWRVIWEKRKLINLSIQFEKT